MRKALALCLLLLPGAALGAAELDAVLADIVGPGRARLVLREETKYLPSSAGKNATALWDKMERRMEGAPPVLPGFRAPRSLREEALRQLKAEAAPSSSKITLRHATLIIDDSVSERAAGDAERLVNDALVLDAERGDTLKVLRMPMRGVAWTPTAAAWLQAAAAAAAALGLWLFLTGRLRLPRRLEFSFKNSPAARILSPGAEGRLASLSPGRAAALAGLLADEAPSACADVLAALNPDAAAAVFRRLSPGARADIAVVLAGRKPGGPLAGENPAERILRKMSERDSGEGLLEDMLLRAPDSVRHGVLERLDRSAPDAARRLRDALFTLNDLANAEAGALRSLLSAFSARELAFALFDIDEDARQRILDALPVVLRELVLAEDGRDAPDAMEEVDSVRAELYARWKRLETSGRVRRVRGLSKSETRFEIGTAAAMLLVLFTAQAQAAELGLPGTNKAPVSAPAEPALLPEAQDPDEPLPGVPDLAGAEAELLGTEPAPPLPGSAQAPADTAPAAQPAAGVEDEALASEPPPLVPVQDPSGLVVVPVPEMPDKRSVDEKERRARLLEAWGGEDALKEALRRDSAQGSRLTAEAVNAFVQNREKDAVRIAEEGSRQNRRNGARWKLLSTLEKLTGVRAMYGGGTPKSLFAFEPKDIRADAEEAAREKKSKKRTAVKPKHSQAPVLAAQAEPADDGPAGGVEIPSEDLEAEEFRARYKRLRELFLLMPPFPLAALVTPDDFDGSWMAAESIHAYSRAHGLAAVLFARASVGADPGSAARRSLLAGLEKLTGVPADAEAELPHRALVSLLLGRADEHFFAERFGAALQQCRAALLLKPDSPDAWTRMGSLHFALGDLRAARKAYAKALELDPKAENLRQFLNERGLLTKNPK